MKTHSTTFQREGGGLRFSFGLLLALLVLLSGCDAYVENAEAVQNQPLAAPETPVPVPSPEPIKKASADKVQSRPPMTDAMITEAVEEKMHRDPVVHYNDIKVNVEKGIVSLEGKTESLLAKERSTRLAETVRGVRSVINTVEVSPPESITDFKIFKDISNEFAISESPDLSEDVSIAVQGGHVTLDGKVDSWQKEHTAVERAKAVRGVKRLTDNIIVELDKKRSDKEISDDVNAALQWDTLVDARLIKVNVTNGRVFLSGAVGSAAEKRQAVEDAIVQSAKGVDADALKVTMVLWDKDQRNPEQVVESDEATAGAVQDAIAVDPRVQNAEIYVSAKKGKVRLTGSVFGVEAKRAAEVDARRTAGVYYVENRIRVKPLLELSDDEIARNIRTALRIDPYIAEPSKIAVSVNNGVVTLEGEAISLFEKMHADVAAGRVPGATAVVNRLDVEGTSDPLVFDPYLGDWYVHDFGRYEPEPQCEALADEVIQDKVIDSLTWSPYVSPLDVEVTVHRGVVTLEGAVKTWAQRRAAVRAALSSGAKGVINELAVVRPG